MRRHVKPKHRFEPLVRERGHIPRVNVSWKTGGRKEFNAELKRKFSDASKVKNYPKLIENLLFIGDRQNGLQNLGKHITGYRVLNPRTKKFIKERRKTDKSFLTPREREAYRKRSKGKNTRVKATRWYD